MVGAAHNRLNSNEAHMDIDANKYATATKLRYMMQQHQKKQAEEERKRFEQGVLDLEKEYAPWFESLPDHVRQGKTFIDFPARIALTDLDLVDDSDDEEGKAGAKKRQAVKGVKHGTKADMIDKLMAKYGFDKEHVCMDVDESGEFAQVSLQVSE